MIVCLCEGVNDATVRRVIREGACSPRDVARSCGAGTGCGLCARDIRQLLREARPSADDKPVLSK